MRKTYERPQQKVLCGSLLTVIALSGKENWKWNDDQTDFPIYEDNPDAQDERTKGRGWNVFGE